MFQRLRFLVPPFLFQLDHWLLTRYPVVWAARLHFLAFYLGLGYAALALLYLSPAFSSAHIPFNYDAFLDPGTFEFYAVWTLPALGLAFWVWHALQYETHRKYRTRLSFNGMLEFFIYWGVIALTALGPILFSAVVEQKVAASVDDEKLAADIQRLNNGAPFLLFNSELVPAKYAPYLSGASEASKSPFSNTLLWNLLNAPIQDGEIQWQNPERTPYFNNFVRLNNEKTDEKKLNALFDNARLNPSDENSGETALEVSEETNAAPPFIKEFPAMAEKNYGITWNVYDDQASEKAYALRRAAAELHRSGDLSGLMHYLFVRGEAERIQEKLRAYFPKTAAHIAQMRTERNADASAAFNLEAIAQLREIAKAEMDGKYMLLVDAEYDPEYQEYYPRRSSYWSKELFKDFSAFDLESRIRTNRDWDFDRAEKLIDAKTAALARFPAPVRFVSADIPERGKMLAENIVAYGAYLEHGPAEVKYELLDGAEPGKPGCSEQAEARPESKLLFTEAEGKAAIAGALRALRDYGSGLRNLDKDSLWNTQLAWNDALQFSQQSFDHAQESFARIVEAKQNYTAEHRFDLAMLFLWITMALAVAMQVFISTPWRLFVAAGVVGLGLIIVTAVTLEVFLDARGWQFDKLMAHSLLYYALAALLLGLSALLVRRFYLAQAVALNLAVVALPALPMLVALNLAYLGGASYPDVNMMNLLGYAILTYVLALPVTQYLFRRVRSYPQA